MAMNRQQQRHILRKVSFFILGQMFKQHLDRNAKRLLSRGYGNAAYRQINDLSHMLYGDSPNGYMKYTLNRPLVNHIAGEGRKVLEAYGKPSTEAPVVEAEGSEGSSVDVQPPDGPDEHSEVDPQ